MTFGETLLYALFVLMILAAIGALGLLAWLLITDDKDSY